MDKMLFCGCEST